MYVCVRVSDRSYVPVNIYEFYEKLRAINYIDMYESTAKDNEIDMDFITT